MKTPAPERAASRKRLAASRKALPDGSFPIPDVAYLRKAVRAVGRAPAGRRPALRALIRRRARELHAAGAKGVKGTWAFQASREGDAVNLAMPAPPTAAVRGPADVHLNRTAPGEVTAMHRSTGRKLGKICKDGDGYKAVHVSGKESGGHAVMSAAVAALVSVHNKLARGGGAAKPGGSAGGYARGQHGAVDLAGSLPHSAPAVSAGDGPRVTAAGGAGKPAKAGAPSAAGLGPEALKVYRELIRRGVGRAAAMAMARRAAALHAARQAS